MEDISVKLYEVNGGDVRRFPFQVPKDPKASHIGVYSALLEKVKQIHPIGDKSKLRLAWKDDEGDLIIMNTDDEVKEALRQRKGDIFRVFVRLADGAETPRVETPVKEAINVFIGDDLMATEVAPREESPKPQAETVHGGIICDGCDQNGIQGVRYKCLMCPDYDLCATCEGKRIHDEHPMIRIPKPGDKSWLPAFMGAQGMSQFGFRGGRRGHCPFFDGRQRGNGRCPQAAASEQQSQEQQPQQQRPQDVPGAQFLRDVGQAVAAVLNGFGIDVDIDVEQDGQRTKVTPPKTDEPAAARKAEEPATVPKAEEKKQDAEVNVLVDQPMENVASPPPAVETMETGVNTPDGHQDWMILDSAEATQETPQAAAAATLPTAPGTSVADPHVDSALAYMMGMGFTNEGGWLTQLLEAKNGDIAAVLEILHPSDKP